MLGSSSEVQFIVHFLNYLKNKNDLEAKAHFLYYLAQKNTSKIAVHDFISSGMEQKEEADFQKWLFDFNFEINEEDPIGDSEPEQDEIKELDINELTDVINQSVKEALGKYIK